MQKQIHDYYYDVETGLSSPDKLYRRMIKDGIKVTRKQIKDFIEKQETHQILRQTKKPKKFNSIVAGAKNNIWQIDCIIYDRFEYHKYKYILCVVDVYTRYAMCSALTNMKIDNIISHLKEIIKVNGKPNNITCDNQFNNTLFNEFAEKEDIKMFYTQPDEINKNAIVERFNKTLAMRLQQWRTSTKRYDWYKVLHSIVKNYNNTYHRTIKHTPQEIWNEEEYNDQDIINKQSTFKVNDKVRIKHKKKVFDKGDEYTYSRDTYIVIEKVKNKFKLKNIKTDTEVKTLYKDYELKKTNEIEMKEPEKEEINEQEIEHKTTQKKRRKRRRINKEGLDKTNILTTKRR